MDIKSCSTLGVPQLVVANIFTYGYWYHFYICDTPEGDPDKRFQVEKHEGTEFCSNNAKTSVWTCACPSQLACTILYTGMLIPIVVLVDCSFVPAPTHLNTHA